VADPVARPALVHVAVVKEALDVATISSRVADPGAGAIATFAGAVRDHHAGKAVSHLEYEAYDSMAKATLAEVAGEASERWDLLGVAIEHRVGRLEIGEASVVIAVATAHRGEAFAALRFLIDELKVRVPIWKRETGPDGTHWIEGPDLIAAAPEAAD
jgi:molybdopterin synthase catalytic subunit